MQQALGRIQVIDGQARHPQHHQRQPTPLADQATAVQHTQADAEQELVDDVVVVEAAEHTQPAQHLTDQ
ncbi:hypothetical protein D3C76_1832740 [compost metagenome]